MPEGVTEGAQKLPGGVTEGAQKLPDGITGKSGNKLAKQAVITCKLVSSALIWKF